MAQDITGKEIQAGHEVVFGMGQSMTLLLGLVVKINPKTVTIEHKYELDYRGRPKRSQRAFDDVVVVNEHGCWMK
jgi:hypothetical protein